MSFADEFLFFHWLLSIVKLKLKKDNFDFLYLVFCIQFFFFKTWTFVTGNVSMIHEVKKRYCLILFGVFGFCLFGLLPCFESLVWFCVLSGLNSGLAFCLAICLAIGVTFALLWFALWLYHLVCVFFFPCCVAFCLVLSLSLSLSLSCPVLSCLVLLFVVLCWVVFCYIVSSCLVLSCLCLVLSCLVVSYLVVLCRVFFCLDLTFVFF